MANKDDYLTNYREFFEYFSQTLEPNNQLPVKLGSYKLLNVEVIGAIIDWTSQYLSEKKCPIHLYSPLIKIIIEEVRKACKKDPINYGFSNNDNAYEPLKLMQAVMAKTNEVCLRYLDNSMLYSLPAPSSQFNLISVSSMKNRRRRMEDRHVVIHDLNTMFNIQEANPSSYYAVFDGHAGHEAAAYSSAHLHQFLAENKYFVKNSEQALLDAFCKTDSLFLEKCKIECLSGGTTAVVALLRPKEKYLYIAWVGDSQALLAKQGTILQCVDPHKPSREDERARIEKAGGSVMLWGTWRVNGQLAVSRAIGDADYKPHVIAIPDVKEIALDGHEDFLILACDGLWDFLSEDAAAQQVYYMIAENPEDTDRIAKHLVELACYQGSSDNISVIVVFLKEPRKIAAEAHFWAKRNGPTTTLNSTSINMEAGLDNANNPFTNSNGSLKNLDVDTDNITTLEKSNEDLLLNLTDNFKANGTVVEHHDILFGTEKSNGTSNKKNSSTDLNFDDDFGPETNVDTVDDVLSPTIQKEKSFAEALVKGLHDESIPNLLNDKVKAINEELANNNPLEGDFNPFLNTYQNKEEMMVEETLREKDFDEFQEDNREDTPTPPTDVVNDGDLEINPTESDSEDEWNYIKGDQAKIEIKSLTTSSQPEAVVEDLSDMSQLNPDAEEFVPISPTRSIPSPASRCLIEDDEIISQSPLRPGKVDPIVPSLTEFECEAKSRPSDFAENGHNHDIDENDDSLAENVEHALNGKDIDKIPEFHPASTPAKAPMEEFHFGPNAVPFASKVLDQSECFSNKADYGDDTRLSLNNSFNDSEFVLKSKEGQDDPMSMSFYAEKGDSNPFQEEENINDEDLNKVHKIPEDLDDFLQGAPDDKENFNLNDTISDLPEHFPLGKPVDNDQAAIQTTDLDKMSQDDEKELASPLEDDNSKIISNEFELDNQRIQISDESCLLPSIVSNVNEAESAISPELPLEINEPSLTLSLSSPVPQELSSPTPEECNKVPLVESTINDIEESTHLQGNTKNQAEDLDNNLEIQSEVISESSFLPVVDPGTNYSHLFEECVNNVENREVFELPQERRDFRFDSSSDSNCDMSNEQLQSPIIERSGSIEIPQSSDEKESFHATFKEQIPTNLAPDLQSATDKDNNIELMKLEKYLELELPRRKILNEQGYMSVDQLQSRLTEPSRSSEIPQSPVELQRPSEIVNDEISTLDEKFSHATLNEQIPKETACDSPQPQVESLSELELLSDQFCSLLQPSPVPRNIQESHIESNITTDSLITETQPQLEITTPNEVVEEIANQQFSLQTENINPEFAESALLTPSEDSKHVEEPIPSISPEIIESTPSQAEEVKIKDVTVPQLAVAAAACAGVAAAATLAMETVNKSIEGKSVKKSTNLFAIKKPTGKIEPTKSKSSPLKVGLTKPPAKPLTNSNNSAKVPAKIGITKTSRVPPLKSTTSAPMASKASPKPKTTVTAASKATEKPISAARPIPKTSSTLLAKKAATETAPKPRPTTATATTKISPTKTNTTASRPATAPRVAPVAFKSAAAAAAAKPRVPLSSRSTAHATPTSIAAAKSATSSLLTNSKTAAKSTVSPTCKPRTALAAATAPKPRVPLTKTVTKSADLEKEKKDCANKLTASRSATATRTSTLRNNITNAKKPDTKIDRTIVSKISTTTTTTTTKSSTTAVGKKPIGIKNNSSPKTKTTKIEKPKQNGITPTNITEEITAVNNIVNNQTESENLFKDNNFPIDNKLLIETNNGLVVDTTTPAN